MNIIPDGVDKIIDTKEFMSLLNSGLKALGHEGIPALIGVISQTALLQVEALGLNLSRKKVTMAAF
ncbi:hypothetical protein F1880_009470 [Penicillium rolfsii]|nr:hypothetical protein F1880_009470 [Penicillium rolfsii]